MSFSGKISRQVTVFEVGPRDGLQNETRPVALADKLAFVRGLVESGVREIELGSFVRADRVPQMSDTDAIYEKIAGHEIEMGKTRSWSLVPNQKGLERAIQVGAKNIAVFTAASDTFNLKNTGMTIEHSFVEIAGLVKQAKRAGMKVRGYVSTAFGCPFEGAIPAKKALKVMERLAKLGVAQVSLGDTLGVATPKEIDDLVRPALRFFGAAGAKKLAVHLHDTRGTALANALRSLEHGVTTIDSSAGGLGGCPFAPGATGNLATEDLVYMLHGMGVRTGVDLEKLCQTSLALAQKMGRPLASRYLMAFAATCTPAHQK